PALKIYEDLRKTYKVDYDATGSIGKRYRRHEEVGTPFCITIDYDGVADQTVTIRHRDTMAQERVSMSKVQQYMEDAFRNWKME
ncbi:MAG: His/Gly/Thr/Pro-type tRNA ligase C-terminal domain-containing protein, partial [Bdellovibrionota bacterium]